ncbi:MAG: hypothetical protein AAB393_09160, partial [Bacteroidota bacterium]
MTHWNVLCLLMSYVGVGFGQDSVSISDFRYPETKAMDWKGGLSGSWSSSQGEGSPGEVTRNDRGGTMGVNASILYFHSKEGHTNTIQFAGSFLYNGSGGGFASQTSTSESSRDQKDVLASLRWMYQHFLGEGEFHVISSVGGDYRLNYRKYNQTTTSPIPFSSEEVTRMFNLDANAIAGIGFGRMRDGSFVYRALRI